MGAVEPIYYFRLTSLESVSRVSEYVRGKAHTNGIEGAGSVDCVHFRNRRWAGIAVANGPRASLRKTGEGKNWR